MTERRRSALERAPDRLQIGPSAMCWDGTALTIDIAEVGAPLPFPIRGTIRLEPTVLTDAAVLLSEAGGHRWLPIAPMARVEVTMTQPQRRWSGEGYLDTNWGQRALEVDFARWHWSRARLADGAAILYDVVTKQGDDQALGFRVDERGNVSRFDPPPRAQLPRTGWRVDRWTQSEGSATVRRTLEDTPFYARSVVNQRLFGASVDAMHESLMLDRFRARWVQVLLPFRMPRTWS